MQEPGNARQPRERMTTFRIDGALFPTVNRESIERVRIEIERFIGGYFSHSTFAVTDIHLQPFRNGDSLVGINVAVTIAGTYPAVNFGGTLTLRQPVLLIGLSEEILAQFIRDVIKTAGIAINHCEGLPSNARSLIACRYVQGATNKSATKDASSAEAQENKNPIIIAPDPTCPECGNTMVKVGSFEKCNRCGHSTGPS